MSQNTKNIGFTAAAVVAAGVAAKAADLPTTVAGLLSVAMGAVCVAGANFIGAQAKVSGYTDGELADLPSKKSKKGKRSEKKSAAAEEAAVAQEEAAAAKAEKKRQKERARKEAKKVEAAKAKAEEEAAKAVEDSKAAAATTGDKKKKKKKKKNASAAAAKVEEEIVEKKTEEVHDDWEEVKQKKTKKKVEENSDSEEEAHTIAVYVDRKHFPVIIGSKGSTLQAITGATGTKIELPKDGGIRTDIIIEGSVEGCEAAKKAIKQLVTKGFSDITDPTKTDSKVAVAESKRSLLVGPGGRNIKMIQAKTNARINLPERGSDEKVTVVGDADAVKAAVKAINQLIETGISDLTHENYIRSEIEVSRDSLKTLIGPGGATIRGLQDETKCKITVPQSNPGETVFVGILGEPEAIADCRARLEVLLAPPAPTPVPEEWTQQASLMHLDQW